MIIDVKPPLHSNVRCYIFGSAVYLEHPSDIDIAIIFDKSKMSIDEAIQYRRFLEQELSNTIGINIDTLLLSEEEESEMNFLRNAKHIQI